MDEQWSFVGNKKNQRWLFYAWEPRFKRIIAHAFGRRTTKTLKKLLKRLSPFKFSYYCTDDWKPYTSCLPEDQHIVGKLFTQRIERQNLTLRTRLKRLVRRTICFSRSVEVHDKVIGEFISREHYQQLWFMTQFSIASIRICSLTGSGILRPSILSITTSSVRLWMIPYDKCYL